MKREIIKTADGSTTIHLPDWNEHYHSVHGAIQEARHVFIKSGFLQFIEKRQPKEISILEVGFGTGLNALVTWQEGKKHSVQINYCGVEAYPISTEEVQKLNYAVEIGDTEAAQVFKKIHDTEWEQEHLITQSFNLIKQKKFFKEISSTQEFDLIYFDAFGARVQPELWTEDIFRIMFRAMIAGGILVTYAAKGSVRRAMLEVGFKVEKLPGPPGKREMLRATKE